MTKRKVNQIILGDCLEKMKNIPDKSVQLCITSPPYNIGKKYEEIMKLGDYISWCIKWINEIHRVTKDNGSFWLNLGYFKVQKKGKEVPIAYLLWDKTPFYLLQEIVWYYKAGVSTKKTFSPRNEKYLWYLKDPENYIFNLDDVRDKNVKYPLQKKNGKLKCNPLGKNPTNVWSIPKVTSGKNRASKERVNHPAQFPLEVIDRIIKACSNEGDLILDPFAGSGTTAIACVNTNRNYICIEKEEKYFNIIQERINNA